MLTIQSILLERCINDLKKCNKMIELKIPLEKNIALLESMPVTINDLFNISKEFQNYDIIIDILFVMYELKDNLAFNSLSIYEIQFTYENEFNFLISHENDYPFCIQEYVSIIIIR